jgi:hypothetical protein
MYVCVYTRNATDTFIYISINSVSLEDPNIICHPRLKITNIKNFKNTMFRKQATIMIQNFLVKIK